MVRLSGRAPNAGSVPSRTISALAVARELQRKVLLGESPLEVCEQQLDDGGQVVVGQGVEHDDLIDPIEELGPELRPQDLGHLALHLLVRRVAGAGVRGRDGRGADVARHDHDGVLEVDRPALAVGQATVVEDLEQDVEHVRVGLLDLVEQHHLVRPAADGLGQLAALVVADVAGRRADQAGHGELLHVLAHVDAHHGGLVVEQELGERPCELRLADAGRDRGTGTSRSGGAGP